MEAILTYPIPLCWAVGVVGWLWLVGLGFKHKGVGSGVLFLMVGLVAMVYGYKMWRHPVESIKTGIPFFMMTGGLTMLVLLVVLSSFC